MPPKRCLIVCQEASGPPGLIAPVLEAMGWEARTIQPYEDDPVPLVPPGDCAALVILGGAMSVHDEGEHPFLADEKRLLRAAVADDFPTLGICLGAQLLAHVAGARVVRGVRPEIGWHPVALTDRGEEDGLFGSALPVAFRPFQWHSDTFDLPRGAVHLAKSALYTRQAFRLGENVYAVQFHLEMFPGLWDLWRTRLPELETQDPARRIAEMEPLATRFLTQFFQRTGAR